MICDGCKTAGAYKALSGPVPEPDKSDLIALAQAWHSHCKGFTWCDCQHVTTPGGLRIDPDAKVWEAIYGAG